MPYFTPVSDLVITGVDVSIQVEFWICLLLTILGYIPGIIYAVYVLVV